MKIQDFDEVEKLVKIRERCQKAIENLEGYIMSTFKKDEDCGGVEGFTMGYYAFFGKHKDGSGDCADMNGCYVGIEAAEALTLVLEKQLDRVDVRLVSLGVTTATK